MINLNYNSSKKKSLEDDDFYYSNDGYITFTEKYHLKRGIVVKVTANIALMVTT